MNDYELAYVYKAKVTAFLTSEGEIEIAFNMLNFGYTVTFLNTVLNIYEGSIIVQYKNFGKASLHRYDIPKGILCRINWEEIGEKTYDGFLELEEK